MRKNKMPHPGEILMKDYLKPLRISQYRLAASINVPAIKISQIVRGQRRISTDTAIRLGHYFGNTSHFWLAMQNHYDLSVVEKKPEIKRFLRLNKKGFGRK